MDEREDMIAYVLGELAPQRCTELEQRLAVDPRAAFAFSSVRDAIEALRSRGGRGPSAGAVARVKGAFAWPRPERAQSDRAQFARVWLGRMEQAGADVLVDSRDRVMLAGCRGDGEGYQLVLASEAADIDVQVRAPRDGGDTWVVLGQIEQEGVEVRGTVYVWRPGEDEVTWEVESDEYGVFRLEVPAGRYHVSVLIGSVAVRLPPLDIG